jgi:hypothetical protein
LNKTRSKSPILPTFTSPWPSGSSSFGLHAPAWPSPSFYCGSLPSFFHQPTSTFTTTSQQYHANLDHDTNQGTSLLPLSQINVIGNRAGNPPTLWHFDTSTSTGLATLNGSFGSRHQLSMVFAILTRNGQDFDIQVSPSLPLHPPSLPCRRSSSLTILLPLNGQGGTCCAHQKGTFGSQHRLSMVFAILTRKSQQVGSSGAYR